MGSVIKVNDVSMMFNLSSEKIDSIKEYFIPRKDVFITMEN